MADDQAHILSYLYMAAKQECISRVMKIPRNSVKLRRRRGSGTPSLDLEAFSDPRQMRSRLSAGPVHLSQELNETRSTLRWQLVEKFS